MREIRARGVSEGEGGTVSKNEPGLATGGVGPDTTPGDSDAAEGLVGGAGLFPRGRDPVEDLPARVQKQRGRERGKAKRGGEQERAREKLVQ